MPSPPPARAAFSAAAGAGNPGRGEENSTVQEFSGGVTGGMGVARILVVDESLLDRKRIGTVLEAAGHQVVEAAGAREARRRLAAQPRGSFQLVITELRLPDQDGLEFLRELQREPAGAGLPILVVTPQPPRETIVEVILAGAENMVAKPFASEVLLRRVTEILGAQRLVRQADAGAVSWSLEDYLRREVKRAERTQMPLTVLAVLPDAPSGDTRPRDELLKALGSPEMLVRETDLVFGVDKHVIVVLPDTDASGARVVEDRIRQVLAALAQPGPDRPALSVRAAFGRATLPEDGAGAELLLQTAMARAGSARDRGEY